MKADKGDKATVVLPDGTDVILNSASQLSYLRDFGKNERRVQLDGEGYFKVAHHTRHTFIVQVGELEVKGSADLFKCLRLSRTEQDVTVVLLKGKSLVCILLFPPDHGSPESKNESMQVAINPDNFEYPEVLSR